MVFTNLVFWAKISLSIGRVKKDNTTSIWIHVSARLYTVPVCRTVNHVRELTDGQMFNSLQCNQITTTPYTRKCIAITIRLKISSKLMTKTDVSYMENTKVHTQI